MTHVETVARAETVSVDLPHDMVPSTLDDLRRLLNEGMASGPAVDGEEAFARLRAAIDARLPPPST